MKAINRLLICICIIMLFAAPMGASAQSIGGSGIGGLPVVTTTGSGNVVMSTSPTLTTPTITNGTYSGGTATTIILTNPTVSTGSFASPSLTTPTITTPALTGGTINNATIGASTATTALFTTLGASTSADLTRPTLRSPIFPVSTKALAGGATWTLTTTEAKSTILVVSSGGTGAMTIIDPYSSVGTIKIVKNTANVAVIIKKSGGSGTTTIAATKIAIVAYDINDYVRVTADGAY